MPPKTMERPAMAQTASKPSQSLPRPRNRGLALYRRAAHRVAGLVLLAALCIASAPAHAIDAHAFGYKRHDATGAAPLLVIWIRQHDDTPKAELERLKQYFEESIFGRPDRFAGYPEALRQLEPSNVGYYQDASGGKFTWRRAGFVGPLDAPVNDQKDPAALARLGITTAATQGHFNFAAFDTNHDGKIGDKELHVLVISSRPEGQTHGGNTVAIPGQNLVFEGRDSVIGEGPHLALRNHELMHQLGAIDLYGPWGGCYGINGGLTVMSGGERSYEGTLGLDPWHKMLFGWTEPRLMMVGQSGTVQLAAYHLGLSAEPLRSRPLLIFDPRKGASDFFMLEYRTPYRLGYDHDVASSGLVIWQIGYDASGQVSHGPADRPDCHGAFVDLHNVYSRGAPDWRQGGNKAYTSEHGEIVLKWADGRDSGVHVTVAPHKPTDPVLQISVTAAGAMLHAEAKR
jgi:M6 family metalloprotease-like protein